MDLHPLPPRTPPMPTLRDTTKARPLVHALARGAVWLAWTLLAIALLPLLLVGGLVFGIHAALLRVAIWLAWCRGGRRVLVCYSNSPHWRERFERHVIPRLPASAIVINRSERATWPRWSLRRQVFEHILGRVDHTPAVIVFRPFWRTRVFRFFGAYQRFKHGDASEVLALEAALFEAVAASAAPDAP